MKKRADASLIHNPDRGKFIRHYIFGAEDGLISTLGLLSGVAGAHLSKTSIAIVGTAGIFAAALSMAIGTFLSSKATREVDERKIEVEEVEIEKNPRFEKQEIRDIYKAKGFRGKELELIVKRITSDKKIWLRELMTCELGVLPGRLESPLKSSLIMFITFFILALIPFFPYFIYQVPTAVYISITLTILALFAVGAVKTKVTHKNWFSSGLEMLALGLLAAIVTYFIGEYISTIY